MSITSRPYLGLVIVLLILSSLTPCKGDDPLPAGLNEAIRNPLVPVIVDATILKYDKLGYGEIKINTIFNIGPALWADSFLYKLESSNRYSLHSKILIRIGKKIN